MHRDSQISYLDQHSLDIQNQHQEPTRQRNQLLDYLSLVIRYFKPIPEPDLVWEIHQEQKLYCEFQEFIESRYQEVKRKSSTKKYYAKIAFQIFIYTLNVLELIFTLSYKAHNQMPETAGTFNSCYLLSNILCCLTHVVAWFYTHKFRQVSKMGLFNDLSFFLYYMIMGGLSYFKVAPFIYYLNRDQSIRQFSFSEINKYLQLDEDAKFRNPCILFKERTKRVNIFRDLIFHRVALVSMIITMTLQTVPQLLIQGLYNTYYQRWDDGFNVFSYILLVGNLMYYISELFFIVFTTTYRLMQTGLNLQFSKIKLKFIQETKQLLKANLKYMGFVKSFYFHIDPSTFSSYQKKRCIVQIITFLTKKQKQFQTIQFLFIDQYEAVTLQYLANCFKLIQVETISLLYKDGKNQQMLEDIFKRSQFPKLNLELMDNKKENSNVDLLWIKDHINPDATSENDIQIQFIENPKINAGWQVLKQSQRTSNQYIVINQDFWQPILNTQIPKQQHQERPEDIVEESRKIITQISKRVLLEEKVGKFTFLIKLYDYFETLENLNDLKLFLQSFSSLLNGSFQIVTIIYLSSNADIFMSALIALNILNPTLQALSFIIFQLRVLTNFSIEQKILNSLLFVILNFLKMWEGILIVLYMNENQAEFTQVEREFSAEAYIKFKSYASKFKGSLAISVFQYQKAQVDTQRIEQIRQKPFFQAVMWRTSVEEALNKIPQFFIFILALTSNSLNALWVISFIYQIKESIFAVKDILEVVIKDYLIPSLILSTVSVEQFFQSMLYFRSLSNSMYLEYPKSFQIVSKVKEKYLKEKCTFKINVKNLSFSNYEGQKQKKMLAQFRYVLASIQTILEIDQAQRLFCKGPEINELIRCLKVSQMKQLKLNYYLDEVDPSHFLYINAFIKLCPPNLQFLQVQLEATEQINMQLQVGRNSTLNAFSYSYFQKIYQIRNLHSVDSEQNLEINNQFLKLDRYNFERLNVEIAGNLVLKSCVEFFSNFKEMKAFKLSLNNNNAEIQSFKFSDNIQSTLEDLEINFENIKLDFQSFQIKKLKIFKITLKKCEFNKGELFNILINLRQGGVFKEIFIDMSKCDTKFTKIEKIQILRVLEQQKFDVTIII